MQPPDPDRVLKNIWLINGVLFLVAAILTVGFFTFLVIADSSWNGGQAVAISPTPSADATPRAVRFDLPQPIYGSTTQLVQIHYGHTFMKIVENYSVPSRAGVYGLYSSSYDGPTVNVAFVPAAGGAARLLFDRPVHIQSIDYPRTRGDSLQTYIAYRVALNDLDGDGGLEPEDGLTLFVTDLDGNNLRRPLGDEWELVEFGPTSTGRELIIVASPARSKKDDSRAAMQHHAFRYDLVTGALSPFTELDDVALRAGQLLASN